MTTDHPITPPPELVQQWVGQFAADPPCMPEQIYIATRAAQWGADQELEACCALLELSDNNARDFLQSARRSKPPSLKEQALDELHIAFDRGCLSEGQADTIRRALEALPE